MQASTLSLPYYGDDHLLSNSDRDSFYSSPNLIFKINNQIQSYVPKIKYIFKK